MPFGPLLAALAEIRDPRRPQGQRYSLRHLLLFSVLAVLAGATSYQLDFAQSGCRDVSAWECSRGDARRVEQALGERSGNFYHVPALA